MSLYPDKKDDALVLMTLLGDERAYEELVIRYEKMAKHTAYRVTGSICHAEDAAQDAFVLAWMRLNCLAEPQCFGAWLRTITRNCAKDLMLHARNDAPDISLHLLEETDLASTGEPTPDELLSEQEEREGLHRAVSRLGERIGEVVRLHYLERLSVEEIATRLSLPAGTVKWRLHEGRRQLRKEYGMMDKKDGKSLTERVMRQVEELKLWSLRENKTGFEAEYRRVLENVEALCESKEKQHALADVLLQGYWWLPGEANEETLRRIREAAEASRNEDAIQLLISRETDRLPRGEYIPYMRNTVIPRLEREKYQKPLGYAWFWLGRRYFEDNMTEEGFDAYRRVIRTLSPSDVYYANAISAERIEKERLAVLAAHPTHERRVSYGATGELLRMVGRRLCFWLQPGYQSRAIANMRPSLLYNASRCDRIMLDLDMKPGECVISSGNTTVLRREPLCETVETPAGIFRDCAVFTVEKKDANDRIETAFAPGVGIVRQRSIGEDGSIHTWQLLRYRARGDGLFPLQTGNRWEYGVADSEKREYERINFFETVYADRGSAVISAGHLTHLLSYDVRSFEDMMQEMRGEYWHSDRDGRQVLSPEVLDRFSHLAKLATTKRQRRHLDIAKDVMQRIIETDPTVSPDCRETGCWNFFDVHPIRVADGKTQLLTLRDRRGFEWKETDGLGSGILPVLANDVYMLLMDTLDEVSADSWRVGEKKICSFFRYGLHVETEASFTDGGTVTTPAGSFRSCLRVTLRTKGLTNRFAYRGCDKEYLIAPGVGIVRMTCTFGDGNPTGVYELTRYEGTGDGYFPIADGLLRRYEAIGLTDGFRASVTYTTDVTDGDMLLFENRLGVKMR